MESVQFKLLQLVFLIAFLLLPSIQAQDLSHQFNRNCTNEEYPVKLTRAKVSFDTGVGGKRITFTFSAFTDQVILGGEVVMDLSFRGVHFGSQKFNLCDEISCPISSGRKIVLNFRQVLPVDVAPGSYSCKIKLHGKDGRQLSCVLMDFTILNPGYVSDL